MLRHFLILFILGVGMAALSACNGTERAALKIAVAANFAVPAETLIGQFEALSGIEATLISGSTGKLYAQIENGAPFDILLAADEDRPQRLEESGLGIAGTRFTYALGELVLWSSEPEVVDEWGNVLSGRNFEHLAIANPELAPYGRAAQDVLQQLDLWDELQSQLVRGENISQTFHFVSNGAAELGFIARSQLPSSGSHWLVPQNLYSPIEQQAIIITSTSHREDAERFLEFLTSDEAREVIINAGYRVPR